jgi:hypothetical protein
MKPPQYSADSMKFLQGELHAFLEANGASTKPQILKVLKWSDRQLSHVLTTQPEWLVGVGTTRGESKHGRMVLYACQGEHVLGFCQKCGRKNFHPAQAKRSQCHACAVDYCQIKYTRIIPGVDVSKPTMARPGSREKSEILGARWDAGFPMHLPGDEYACRPGWDESQEEPEDYDEDE